MPLGGYRDAGEQVSQKAVENRLSFKSKFESRENHPLKK